MSRDAGLYLKEIEEACRKILRFTEGFGFEELKADPKTLDAVLRNFEVIGEAAKRVPPEVRDKHPEIEWRKIGALRDVLIPETFSIDHAILWDLVKSKAPALLEQVRGILTKEPGG